VVLIELDSKVNIADSSNISHGFMMYQYESVTLFIYISLSLLFTFEGIKYLNILQFWFLTKICLFIAGHRKHEPTPIEDVVAISIQFIVCVLFHLLVFYCFVNCRRLALNG